MDAVAESVDDEDEQDGEHLGVVPEHLRERFVLLGLLLQR